MERYVQDRVLPAGYVIESIRNTDGTAHEREARRKGQRVEIVALYVDLPLFLRYLDEENASLRTSCVRSIEESADGLVVTTKNTVYTFRKDDEE